MAHEKHGKGYKYYPFVKKETYSNQSINKLVNNYFNGSFKSMVSFFAQNNEIDLKEMESILKEIRKK